MITSADLKGKRVVCKTCGCAPVVTEYEEYGECDFPRGTFGCAFCKTWSPYVTSRSLALRCWSEVLKQKESAAQVWFAQYGELLPALQEVEPREEYALMGEW